MTEFFTWQVLATFAGCAVGTGVIVQFLKNVKFIAKLSPQLVSYVVALVLLYGSYFFTGCLSANNACIIPFNAIAVCMASNGVYDLVKTSTIASSSKNLD